MAAKKSPGGLPIPPEKKAKVIDEYKRIVAEGTKPNLTAIAKKFGIHGSTLGYWLKAEGLHKPLRRSNKGDTPNLVKARSVHAERLKNDPAYAAEYSAKLRASKRRGAETGSQLMLPAVANGHVANGHMVTSGHGDEGELDYLREALRTALREREALRITLDIVMREQHAAQGSRT